MFDPLASLRTRPLCLRALCRPAGVLVLALAAWGPGAPGTAACGEDPEVGGPVPPPPAAPAAGQSVVLELETGAQYLVLSEDDMHDTYGGLPMLTARLSLQVDPVVRVYLGTGYGHAGGDPYYDQPEFRTDDDADLDVVPFRLGLRFAMTPSSALQVNLGFFLELTWVRESLPAAIAALESDADGVQSGLTRGVGVVLGPLWRPAGSNLAIGLEAVLTGNSGQIGTAPDREVNLSGAGARVYVATGL